MLPARAAEMEAADIIALGVRLGIIVLGAAIMLRVSGALTSRLARAIRERGLGDDAAREKRARTIGAVLGGGGRTLVVVVAALMAVRELGLDITPALATAGGFGVAAGLGAQSLVRDWISGFFIILDDQFGVGDVVRVAGVTGTIEALSLRSTELRDGDGSLHFIPNGEIKIVTNLTRSWAAPLLRIPVNATEDPERVLRVIDEMARAFKADPATAPLLVDGPNVLGIEDVAGGLYTVLIQAKTRPENRHPVGRALRLAALRRLSAEGISLAPSSAVGISSGAEHPPAPAAPQPEYPTGGAK
ncbi:MAG TPA: mechanosensitive ion channel domain-containing protein [Candidatus Eisenbacteria bacterium]|nr:mechanosensitive ion channel domain-containing protein [Candidatus Eisenbacteria bacterium]